MAKQTFSRPFRAAHGIEGATLERPLAPAFTAHEPEPPAIEEIEPDLHLNEGGEGQELAPIPNDTSDSEVDMDPEELTSPNDPEPKAATPAPEIPIDPAAYWRPMPDAPKDRPIFLTDDIAENNGALAFWRTTRVRNAQKSSWEEVSFWARLMDRRVVPFDPIGWRESGMFRTVES